MCTSLSPIAFATLTCVHLNGDIIVATEDWIFCHQPLPPHAAFIEAYALCLTMQSALFHPLRKGVRIPPGKHGRWWRRAGPEGDFHKRIHRADSHHWCVLLLPCCLSARPHSRSRSPTRAICAGECTSKKDEDEIITREVSHLKSRLNSPKTPRGSRRCDHVHFLAR